MEQANAVTKYTSLAMHNRSRELTAETKVIARSSAESPRACVLRRTFFEGTAFIDYRLRGYLLYLCFSQVPIISWGRGAYQADGDTHLEIPSSELNISYILLLKMGNEPGILKRLINR
jgi:hypothetical protein